MSGVAETRNLSSGGALIASDTKVDIGEPVEYVIRLSNMGDVDLHCLGKVMRLDTGGPGWEDSGKPFEMAVTLERYEFRRVKD